VVSYATASSLPLVVQRTTGKCCLNAVQELGPKHFWISEALFAVLFGCFVLWLISPFWTERKGFYCVVVLQRLLVHLVCALSSTTLTSLTLRFHLRGHPASLLKTKFK
jgi:hypothetical protein